jgi:hypothetical protein
LKSTKIKGKKDKGVSGVDNSLLIGLMRYTFPMPRVLWQKQVARNASRMDAGQDFMSSEHRLVHRYVVREIVCSGKPLAPETIARALNLQIERVVAILTELEEHKGFLFRNAEGAVNWAYPVTAEKTPHLLKLNTGEQVYAA